jgi:hypothetical protein
MVEDTITMAITIMVIMVLDGTTAIMEEDTITVVVEEVV